MKRILLLLLVCALVQYAYSRKSYVVAVYSPTTYIRLSGDVPEDMEPIYTDIVDYKNDKYVTIGQILNTLSSKGFEVESVSATTDNGKYAMFTYLLSKPDSSSAETKVQTVNTDESQEAKEIARYNLQGLPVTESDKGLQIIVYSNYTTKTILVE